MALAAADDAARSARAHYGAALRKPVAGRG
jgi:hypothetical protein